jgi:Transglycosylase SLT domain/SPOR domain
MLPVDFLTRLIWKESRFDADAISPKGAQGIAQFMPGTAALRGLADPFDPTEAIPASAHYLRDLSIRFGNLGLAAAAYNAGEERVSDWLVGTSRLPWETRDYVLFITGRTAEDWTSRQMATDAAGEPTAATCGEIASLLSKPGAGSDLVSGAQIETAAWAPWGVQVAGGFSQARAIASYARLQRKYSSLLGDRAPLVLRSVMRSRGAAPFTQIRLPAGSQNEANQLCRRLRDAGLACLVLKNTR